jgi:hypothetical protein
VGSRIFDGILCKLSKTNLPSSKPVGQLFALDILCLLVFGFLSQPRNVIKTDSLRDELVATFLHVQQGNVSAQLPEGPRSRRYRERTNPSGGRIIVADLRVNDPDIWEQFSFLSSCQNGIERTMRDFA